MFLCVDVFLCLCSCLFSDIQQVLRDDLVKLKQMQKNQPRFSEEQKRELAEVHPWVRGGGALPKAINVEVSTKAKDINTQQEVRFTSSPKSPS